MTAPARPFVHLHCHSHYSLLDGASEISALVQRAKALGMNALALTDHGNLHGALEFYRKAKDAGLNPILGYEAYIAPGSRFDKKDAANSKEASYHLTLLAQNRTGFKNLIKLASAASLEGFYYKPRIDKELLQAHHEGLLCLSGCLSSKSSFRPRWTWPARWACLWWPPATPTTSNGKMRSSRMCSCASTRASFAAMSTA
jgi:DNA polymerase-3 subunit alpha